MVKRRVRHTSSTVGRPAGTGARSHWSSSGTQQEEERGEREGERKRGQGRRGRTEEGREGSRIRQGEGERVQGKEQGAAAGWGLPPQRIQWREKKSRRAKKVTGEKKEP